MRNVLLVEDDPFIRDITSIKLAEHNCSVSTARTGEEALASIKKEKPDVVLLDLDLPDISGIKVISALKADPLLKEIPIIIFSNNDDPDTQAEVQKLGVSAFFVKATTAFDDLYAYLASIIKE
jgi:CheY-like chemotaxis protein